MACVNPVVRRTGLACRPMVCVEGGLVQGSRQPRPVHTLSPPDPSQSFRNRRSKWPRLFASALEEAGEGQ